jgi:hypothetical protein
MNRLNLRPAVQFDDMYLIGYLRLGGANGNNIPLPDGLKKKQHVLQIIDEGDFYDRIMDSVTLPCLMSDGTHPVFVCVHANDLMEIASELPQSLPTNGYDFDFAIKKPKPTKLVYSYLLIERYKGRDKPRFV